MIPGKTVPRLSTVLQVLLWVKFNPMQGQCMSRMQCFRRTKQVCVIRCSHKLLNSLKFLTTGHITTVITHLLFRNVDVFSVCQHLDVSSMRTLGLEFSLGHRSLGINLSQYSLNDKERNAIILLLWDYTETCEKVLPWIEISSQLVFH